MPQQMRARRAFTYNTRRLLPGDVFDIVRPSDVRILKAIKKAEEVRPEAPVPAPPAPLAQKLNETFGDDDLKAARAEYSAAIGRQPYYGWDAATLREKIAAAKQG